MDIRPITAALYTLTSDWLRKCTDDQLTALYGALRWAAVRVVAERTRRAMRDEEARTA